MAITIIESERLSLDPMSDKDYDLYHKLYTDEYLTRHIGGALDSQKAKRSRKQGLRDPRRHNG